MWNTYGSVGLILKMSRKRFTWITCSGCNRTEAISNTRGGYHSKDVIEMYKYSILSNIFLKCRSVELKL